MINLLPPKQKDRLLAQTYFRLAIILGILFIVFLICLFLSLLLVKSYVLGEIETQKILLEEKKRTISLNQDMEKKIRESNAILGSLEMFYQGNVNVTQTLERINGLLPYGTYLKEFSFNLITSKGETERRFAMSGYCPSRDRLITFKEDMEREENLFDVFFSPSSWIKPNDINFSVSFKVKNN